ncbi:glycosyltransferase [Myxococcota bacterium]|nr:glycosyltransferase [Myxococcota bacterium]
MDFYWLIIWASLGWVAFGYAGYPLALWLMSRLSPRPVVEAECSAFISVIITVYNGERELQRKLENTLGQQYGGNFEIIVASDGSTDGSDEIARSFEDRGVRWVRNAENSGKETAQALAISQARGEILVFTDTSAILEPNALACILRPFADPAIGCVSSEDVVDPEQGEGAYVRFEMALRRLESEASTLVGLSGSFFAARRELCDPWPTDLASDFRMGIEAASRGRRAVCQPSARARIPVTHKAGGEWRRKVRTFRRGIAVLMEYRAMLRPSQGRAAFSLWGHKLARFTSPFALITLFVASGLAAVHDDFALVLWCGQIFLYGLGGASLLLPPLGEHLIPRLASFFLLVNAAVMNAWIYHLRGQRAVKWEPTQR